MYVNSSYGKYISSFFFNFSRHYLSRIYTKISLEFWPGDIKHEHFLKNIKLMFKFHLCSKFSSI